MQRTIWQVTNREAVLDTVAGLSVTPTLQAGIFLLGRLQHAVTAQTLRKGKDQQRFHEQDFAWLSKSHCCFPDGFKLLSGHVQYVASSKYHRLLPEHRQSKLYIQFANLQLFQMSVSLNLYSLSC